MNLHDAHKTGKKYRRTHESFGDEFGIVTTACTSSSTTIVFMYGEYDTSVPLSAADVLADDWVVEEVKLTLEELADKVAQLTIEVEFLKSQVKLLSPEGSIIKSAWHMQLSALNDAKLRGEQYGIKL